MLWISVLFGISANHLTLCFVTKKPDVGSWTSGAKVGRGNRFSGPTSDLRLGPTKTAYKTARPDSLLGLLRGFNQIYKLIKQGRYIMRAWARLWVPLKSERRCIRTANTLQ